VAVFKTLPNYELVRDGFKFQFNLEGEYVTYKEDEIKYLEGLAPFIKRIDEDAQKKPAEPKAKAATKPKK